MPRVLFVSGPLQVLPLSSEYCHPATPEFASDEIAPPVDGQLKLISATFPNTVEGALM